MLSNNKRPTAREKRALSYWVSEVKRCIANGNDFRSKKYPIVAITIYNNYISSLNSLVSELYAGNITYGSFAKKRAVLSNDFNIATAKAVQEMMISSEAIKQQKEISEVHEKQNKETERIHSEFLEKELKRQEALRKEEMELEERIAIQNNTNALLNRLNQQSGMSPLYTAPKPYYITPYTPQPFQAPPIRTQTHPTHTHCYTIGNQLFCDTQ